jgi:hypothetical protein
MTMPNNNPDPTQPQGDPATDAEPELGEAGKKALSIERDARKAAENTVKDLQKQLKESSAAAKRLAEIEDAQKTQAERDAERIAKAEAEAASIPAKVAESLRSHLIEVHSIEADDAELFLTATDPGLLVKQANRLVSQRATTTTSAGPKPNPQQGTPSQGRGGSVSAGRERYAAQHPK